MTLTPRPYQLQAVQSIFDYYGNGGTGNCVIALPTGLGKSLLPAMFIKHVLGVWPNQRFLMVTHSRTLIDQNYKQMLRWWPNAPIGVYSAGLKRREYMFPVVYGGIASMHKKAELFGHRDICFVDEAHMISPTEDTMYQRLFSDLRAINPNIKIVGMTATDFRPNHGSIIDGKLFHAKCYDGVSYKQFNQYIADGYMAPLVGKPTNVFVDTSKLSTSQGDFNQGELESAVNAVTREGLNEFAQIAADRRAWLMFAGGIDNAEFMAQTLRDMGFPGAAVHSKLSNDEQDLHKDRFLRGEYRFLCNFSQLTTGYDNPAIDALGVFRATKSPNLHVQIGGRGTRIAPGKIDCLYADFGRNIERLGLINDPRIPQKKSGGKGEIPVKICDHCGVYNHISARVCDSCGAEFEFKVKITKSAIASEVLRNDNPVVETFTVSSIIYRRHKDMMKVSYTCGLRVFSEIISFENPRAAKFTADWWRQRSAEEIPLTTELALTMAKELRKPERIIVWLNRMYEGKVMPRIQNVEF